MSNRWKISPVVGSDFDFLEQAGERPFEDAKKTWWHSLFYGCAACVGGAAGHAGCLIAPLLTLGANGATAASGHNPALMIGSALAINTVTLGLWYRLRGRFVSKPIKLATIGFAIAGMAITTGINLRQHVHDHGYAQAQTWYDAQPPEAQKNIKEIAGAFHMSVPQYLTTFEICSPKRPNLTEQNAPQPSARPK